MNRSRRRNCNTVNAASLARWIVMTAFLALAGLAYVYLTLQLYHLGERRKAVENELASSPHSKRYRLSANRDVDVALGIAAPIERRLPENGSGFRVQDRAAYDARPVR